MKTTIVIGIWPPISNLKILVLELWSKCCCPIRLLYSLKCNISRKKWMIKFIFGMQMNIDVFYKLIVCIGRHAQSTQNKQICNIFTISQGKRKGWSWFFCLQINVKGFFELILLFYVCVARQAQITKNNKWATSSQYLKKEVSDEVGFFHSNKHESFLQIVTTIFDGNGQWSSIPELPKIVSLQCLFNISKKEVRDKLSFCFQIDIKVSYKLISTLWALKFFTRWYYHTQRNKFAICLQYLKK